MNERAGVLVLSENAGAHEELGAFALSVNPFDLEGTADAIEEALTMPDSERLRRAEGIRDHVREHDVRAWMTGQLADLDSIVDGECALSDSMLIVAALNGTRSRLECPKVPLTAEDLATEAKRAVEAGAGLVHVHARKKDGLPAFDLFIEDVVKAIRGKVDVPISISTQRTRSISLGTVTAIFDVLRELPDLATVGVRAPEPDQPSHREEARQILEACEKAGVRPEPVVIGVDSLGDFETLYNDSLLSKAPYIVAELGPSDGRGSDRMAGTPHNVLRLADACRATFSRFDVVMSGQDEASPIAQAVAAAAGHHVRCGFQDAATMPDGGEATSNAQLVEMAVRLAEAVGRHPMEPDDVRAMLR